MKVSVKFTPAMVGPESDLRQASVVVIDTLRATSTIVTALMAGAREIIPAATIEEAVAIAHRLGTDRTLLGGERGGVKINGFPFGNSPLEYTPEAVHGKTIVMTTSNGAGALIKARNAGHGYCASMLNASVIVERLIADSPAEVLLICAGNAGDFSIEDTITAGAIVSGLMERSSDLVVTDSARCARQIFEDVRNDLFAAFSEGDHGRALLALGFENDIRFCSQLDIPDAVVPTMIGSSIKLYQEQQEKKTVARFV